MKLLLDTHVLIWSAENPTKLSERVTNLLNDTSNSWVISIASIWEMQIKIQTGKLTLDLPLHELIEIQQQFNELQLLQIKSSHIYALRDLPNHHRDPFDRMLITQAIIENMPLISIDKVFESYSVAKIW